MSAIGALRRALLPTVSLAGNHLTLRCPYYEKEKVKQVPGYNGWDRKTQRWLFAVHPEALQGLRAVFPALIVGPEAEAAVKRVGEIQRQAAEMKADPGPAPEALAPMPIKTKPFRHQVVGYNVALSLLQGGESGVSMLMEQGCGKTLVAIAVAGRLYLDNDLRRVLVVAPKSVVPVWPKEFAVHSAVPHRATAFEPPWAKGVERLLAFQPEGDELLVAIINYEATWRILQPLLDWAPQLIIADESQRIKSPGTEQSKAMHKLGKAAQWRMILTGTPVTQAPLDFFSQYKFLDGGRTFGRSYHSFRSRYAVTHPEFKKKVLRYLRLDELTEKAHRIAYRITKAEALDLPDTVDQILYCDLSSKGRRVYRDMVKQSMAELEASGEAVSAPNVLAKLTRLQQITGGWVNDDDGNPHHVCGAKQALAQEAIADLLDAGKKVVVFCRYLRELHGLVEWLEKQEVGHRWIDGSVTQAARGEAVEAFQADPEVKVFLAQIATAGLGITLTAADTAIFYSLTFSYADYEQARARLHRIGQTSKVTYLHLVARDTVDERVLEVLSEKRDLADQVVDGWRELLAVKGR